MTELNDKTIILKQNKFSNIIKFKNSGNIFIQTKQANLFKCMINEVNTDIKKAHGCKNPDECYIDEKLKNM